MRSALGLAVVAAYACSICDCRRWIALFVVTNGVLYHGSVACQSHAAHALLLWDVTWNAILCAWMNASSTAQPRTLVGSAVAMGCWMVGRSIESDALHVVGVQLLGLACLMTMFARPRRAMCTS